MTCPLAVVVTTIQGPTASMRRLAGRLSAEQAALYVIGDAKGPSTYELSGTTLLTLAAQLTTPFHLARLLPTGHYTRKNVGYLKAISDGAGCIYETDDDNEPATSWAPRIQRVPARAASTTGWHNAYRHFSDELIWPRGYPLDAIRATHNPLLEPETEVEAPIQQGLANGSPDVDAIWRLALDRDFRFRAGPSVLLPAGTWCPFNSQSTWWWPRAFPLLYLPSYCTFRMTDIWRSFVAQRCLWELGHGVVFHAPEVEQERNQHDLMKDFEQEIPGYLQNQRLAGVLERLALSHDPDHIGANLLICYGALVREGFVGEREIPLVEAWNEDLAGLTR